MRYGARRRAVGCDDGVPVVQPAAGRVAAEPLHEGGVGVGAAVRREERALLELHVCDGREHAAGVVAAAAG